MDSNLRYRLSPSPTLSQQHCAASSFLIAPTPCATSPPSCCRISVPANPSMNDCSDLDRKVPATKKLPSRSTMKRVVYFDKSDSELESDEDGDEVSKKRSFKK